MPRRILAAILCSAVTGLGASAPEMLTYDTLPHGTEARPLILRTYLPDPGLGDEVFAHHGRGGATPEYSPEKGEDLPGIIEPLSGVPAAIAVNHGPILSYVFDTTECRLLYAWQGGFLDMYPYWGEKGMGTRLYDYVPRLVGTLFYRTAGATDPLQIDGRSASSLGAPRFVGYDLVRGQPVFLARHGRYTVRTKVEPIAGQNAMRVEFSSEPAAALSYKAEYAGLRAVTERSEPGRLVMTLQGDSLGVFEGYSRKVTITEASIAAGERLYRDYACAVCHSTDGSLGHGPSWVNLFGRQRPLADGSAVLADDAYILESIKDPNAKIAQGFSPNFMPPYSQLDELEYQSLLLFIKSIRSGQ